MKIIGFGKDDAVILTASKDEVAHFRGEYSGYNKKLDVGDSFNVHKMYENAVATLAAYKELKGELDKMQKNSTRLLSLMKGDEE